MGLYGFKRQFWPFVLDGTKRHTIRCPRRYPDGPGDLMHMYGMPRRPEMFRLMSAECAKVEPIVLELDRIELAGVRLTADERDALAWCDGFRPEGSTAAAPGDAFRLMAGFWRASQLPLVATMNHWAYPPVSFGDRRVIRARLRGV